MIHKIEIENVQFTYHDHYLCYRYSSFPIGLNNLIPSILRYIYSSTPHLLEYIDRDDCIHFHSQLFRRTKLSNYFHFEKSKSIKKQYGVENLICQYLRSVQYFPFQPCEQTHVPFLHWPCAMHRVSQASCSHKVPLQPSSHLHLPDSQIPWSPQSKLQIAWEQLGPVQKRSHIQEPVSRLYWPWSEQPGRHW